MKAQGTGLLPKDQMHEMGMRDLKAISTFLGDKAFMMGAKPSALDCVVFGFMVQVRSVVLLK